MQELKGVGVALVTPFQENGKVDYAALEKLLLHVSYSVNLLIVMGSTGEALTLSPEEQMAVLDFILEINAGKLPVVFGMGGSNTADLKNRLSSFDREGVTAFLISSPPYNKPSQEGIFRHFLELDKATDRPIILYNVPGRTAGNVLPETVVRIAQESSNIKAIKEAAGSIEQVMALSSTLPDDFILLSGDDPLLIPHMAAGGDGIISVVANAYPNRFGQIYRACVSDNYAEARNQYFPMIPLIKDLFAEGNPGGIKEVLKHLGICDNHLRLPLVSVSDEHSKRLYRRIAELGEE